MKSTATRSAASPATNAPQSTLPLNFLLVGERRSGCSAVADMINNHGAAYCHSGLFAADAACRRDSHEAYFGVSQSRRPDWFCCGDRELEHGRHSNPYEYLVQVLDCPLRRERAIGIYVDYATLARYQLYELITELTARGDFCVLHMVRNPLACLISLRQAEESGCWVSYAGDSRRYVSLPVSLPPDDVYAFIERSCTARDKVAAAAADAVEIHYVDLVTRLPQVAAGLFRFLELNGRRAVCRTRRLVTTPLCRRFLNFEELRRRAPHAQSHWFNDKEIA